ncbi:FIST signal transduction protein [Candidatus Omnitrophota bacterium]
MSTKIGLGVSTKLDPFVAGREATKDASYQLSELNPAIVIVFISTIFEQQQVIRGIRSIIKETPLIGCSAAGSLTSLGASKDSVAVCIIGSDSIRFSCGAGYRINKNPRLAGSDAARQSSTLKNTRRQLYIMFSDGLSVNSAEVLRGAQEVLGTSFPIIGGVATDNLRFHKTYQYLGNVYTDAAVGLLMSGDIDIGIGNAHGWRPIGKPHKITKATSNTVREIDKKIAVELYEDYLNTAFDELKLEGIAKLGSSYPLGMSLKEKKEYLIRAPIKVEDNGSLILSAEVPEQQEISLMIGDKTLVLEATKKACVEAVKNIKSGKIKFAIVFSDIGRLQVLRKNLESEVEIIKSVLGNDVPFFGCYTYGQYGPIDMQGAKGQSYFHNQAISIAIFSE